MSDDAVEICAQALLTPNISADDQSIIYVTHASYLINKNLFDQAENTLELAFNVNPKMLENGSFRYNWLRTKGRLYFTKEEFVTALPFFEQAVNVAEIMQSNKTMATSYNDLGATYLEIDNYTQALIWLQKSLAIHKADNNLELSAMASANIAEIYLITAEHDQALSYFNAAIEQLLQAATENPEKQVSLAKVYLSVANLLMAEEHHDDALSYLQMAMAIYQQYDLKGEQVKVLSTMGKMYLQQSKPDNAMSYLLQAQALESSLESQDNLEFKQVLVDAFIFNKQWQKAENHAAIGLELAVSKNSQLSEIGFLKSLAVINEQAGNLTQAVAFLKQAEALNQNLLENKYDSTRAKLLAELESSKKQHDLNELQKQATINELQLKQQRLMFSLLAVLLLFLIGFLMFKLRLRKKTHALIVKDQLSHSHQLTDLTISNKDIDQLFKGIDSSIVCFDLSGLIKFCSVEDISTDLKMAEAYPEIWRLTLAALDEEDQLFKDLYLDVTSLTKGHAVMVHQMKHLDNLLVAVFLPSGELGEKALTHAENIHKYSEFYQQLKDLITYAEALPVKNINTINQVLLATKAMNLTESSGMQSTDNAVEFKKALVDLMVYCIEIWQLNSSKSNIELAEQSGLWLVSIENGQLRTRTMNRYLHIDKIPDNPRWQQVVKTAHYILSDCELNLSQRQQLNEKINGIKNQVKSRAMGQ